MAPGTSFRVGMSSYALRWAIQWNSPGIAGVLRQAASLGAQVVQVCDNLKPEERPEGELSALAALAGELGIDLELGATGFTPPRLSACLSAASALRAPIVRMVIGSSGAGDPAALERALRSSLPELEDRNLSLAIENHFDLSPADLKQLVETIGSPRLGICLDVFNSVYHLSSQAETLACLAPYTLTVHVKDVNLRRLNTGFYVYGCRLGEGRLDLERLFTALRRAGKMPALLMESWMDRLDGETATCEQEETWLRDGIQYLKQRTMSEVQ